ncbi:MAG TPA: NAD(P)-dependent oxidoreductase [Kofleriaceae bacterium]
MKRVLVTGPTGFIGRHCLAPLVARGYEVHAVERARPDRALPEVPGVRWHTADLLAPGIAGVVAAIAPSHLLHLAWYAVPGKYWSSTENLRWVRASLALYEAFAEAGGSRSVIGGTAAEYDWSGGVCRERDTPLAPWTNYGTCKRALSEVVAADAAVAKASHAWARFFFLYGPDEYPERLVASVIRALLRGEVARCSPGTQRRDFLHVADAAEAVVALLDSGVEGPVNVASGEARSVKSIVERIVELVAGEGRLELGSLPADHPPLVVADIARLRDEVGFQPSGDPDARLRETVEWWRAREARVRQEKQ